MDMQAKGRYLAFISFALTLCFILVIATGCLFFKVIDIAAYKEIIMVLGIPTIIGMAFNSFFHTNPKPEDDPNAKVTSTTVTSVNSPVEKKDV